MEKVSPAEAMLEKQNDERDSMIAEADELWQSYLAQAERFNALPEEQKTDEERERLARLEQKYQGLRMQAQAFGGALIEERNFMQSGVPVVVDDENRPQFDFVNNEKGQEIIEQGKLEMQFARLNKVFGTFDMYQFDHELEAAIKNLRQERQFGNSAEWDQKIQKMWDIQKKIRLGNELLEVGTKTNFKNPIIEADNSLSEEQQQEIIKEGFFSKEDLITISQILGDRIKKDKDYLDANKTRGIKGLGDDAQEEDVTSRQSLKEKLDKLI
jgi:hypothetical protein